MEKNQTKCWFFEKIDNIDKPQTRLIKKERKKEKEHTNYQYQEWKGDITIDPTHIKKSNKSTLPATLLRICKFYNLDETDNSLQDKLPKLTQEIEILNSLISVTEISFIIFKLSTKKAVQMASLVSSIKHLQKK